MVQPLDMLLEKYVRPFLDFLFVLQLCHDLVELFHTRPDSIPLRTVLLALGTHLPKGFLNAFHPFVERSELIFSSRW
uniref:Uncharacterized protein n=1 Tax=Anopheles atroparvus TaxID=41427 RepID=A0AAG5D1V9_ANOAO